MKSVSALKTEKMYAYESICIKLHATHALRRCIHAHCEPPQRCTYVYTKYTVYCFEFPRLFEYYEYIALGS